MVHNKIYIGLSTRKNIPKYTAYFLYTHQKLIWGIFLFGGKLLHRMNSPFSSIPLIIMDFRRNELMAYKK